MALALLFAAPIATAAAAVPTNTVAPSFSGVLQEGELLTADPGTWTGSPTSYAYAWYSCSAGFADCDYIAGATQQTLLADAADVGRYIGVDVIATNAEGNSDPVAALPRGPILVGYPEVTTLPAVAGTPQEGQTLTADPGTWTPAATSYTYQWIGCDAALTACDAIAGATAPTYRLAPGDVGRRLVVGVVATNAGGPSDAEFSAPTEPVLAAPLSTTNPPPPSSSSPPPPPPAAVVVTPPPLPAAVSPFAMLRRLARADGRLELSVRARSAGRFTARATASAALLARGCVSTCKRTGRGDFGSASVTKTAAGVAKLVIKPSARAARALRRSRTLPVRVTLTFRPAGGGAATSRDYSLTAKGTLALARLPRRR